MVDKVGCMYGGGMSFARRVRFLLTPGLVESSTWMICTTSTSKEAGHACAKESGAHQGRGFCVLPRLSELTLPV